VRQNGRGGERRRRGGRGVGPRLGRRRVHPVVPGALSPRLWRRRRRRGRPRSGVGLVGPLPGRRRRRRGRIGNRRRRRRRWRSAA
jgi:hypothetical protein